MALIAKPGTPAEAAAATVRTQVAHLVATTRMHLGNIRLEVQKAGKTPVAAVLGAADAAELAAFYSKAKAMLEAVGETVEDLPA
jgi:hypothetical protein